MAIIEIILLTLVFSFLIVVFYEKGKDDFYYKILKNNPDYYLTVDLKIEKVWCIPD